MPRGGYREGSGGKPTWKHGQTKPIRVPVALVERVLALARLLDDGHSLVISESPKCIDLSGVAIIASPQGPIVRLADLVRIGYTIKPDRLTRNLKPLSLLDSELSDLLQIADNHDQ